MAEPSGSSSSSGLVMPARAGEPTHQPYVVAGLPAKEQLKPGSGKRTPPLETDPSEVELAADPPKTFKSQKTDRLGSPGGRAAEAGAGAMMALPPSDMSDLAGTPGDVLSKRFVSHALAGPVQHDGPPRGEIKDRRRLLPTCGR